MSEHNLVSIIIPTYNRADLIPRAIESILRQTYGLIEIIVVDDGSQDDTKKVLSQYASNIRYIYQHHQGVSAAMNAGIRETRGEFIAILDSDDELLPEAIEKMVFYLETNLHAAMVAADYLCKQDGKWRRPAVPKKLRYGNIYQDLLMHDFIASIAVLIRKSTFSQIGDFDASLPSLEDYDLWLRISEASHIGILSEPVAIYHLREECFSDEYRENLLTALVGILKKNMKKNPVQVKPIEPELRDRLRINYLKLSAIHKRKKEFLKCCSYFLKALLLVKLVPGANGFGYLKIR